MVKLKLSDWASIAEVVGAVAVVLSLVYVGIQINENTTEAREANRQMLVNRSFDATQHIATNPGLATIFEKVADGKPLDAVEQIQYSYFIRGLLYDIQEGFLLHREGRLSDVSAHLETRLFEQCRERCCSENSDTSATFWR